MNEIETKRNELNLEIRQIISIMNIIDGRTADTENYEVGQLSELEYLEKQLNMVKNIKERLTSIFKD